MHRMENAQATHLQGLVFASEALATLNQERVRQLAECAAQRHAELGVTGHAYFHDGRLIEYIEGSPEAIDQIIAALESDQSFTLRHIVRSETLPARRFETWELDACADDELMDLRLEHVLEALLQNFASSLFGPEPTQAAIWRLVDAIARRQAKAGKATPRARATRLVTAH